MDKTQFLIFELGRQCNLGAIHTACPNLHKDRFAESIRELDDETILRIARDVYWDHGFRGLVGWHYYNEPLLQQERMFRLMDAIKWECPQAGFILWTNGTRLPADCAEFAKFDQIHITDYSADGRPPRNLPYLQAAAPRAQIHRWTLDQRLHMLGETQNTRPCLRPFTEFIVDYSGRVHICCYDWRGLASPGSVYDCTTAEIVAKWQAMRDSVVGERMAVDAPEACRRCTMRCSGHDTFVREPGLAARKYRAELISKPVSYCKPAVVFVSYRIPTRRLREHFRWNDSLYRASGVRVYVVTDHAHDLPEYSECVLFPEEDLPEVDGKRRFSLTRTKNAGIRRALAGDCDVIVSADVDLAFDAQSWRRALAVRPSQAVAPVFLMSPDYERRGEGKPDYGATGCIAMAASNWRQCQYKEDLWGYGSDDGALLHDIHRAGLRILRDGVVYHIAHDPTAPQVNQPGHGRADCWNRDEFNIDNFEANKQAWDKR
jgi:hypothetical protein